MVLMPAISASVLRVGVPAQSERFQPKKTEFQKSILRRLCPKDSSSRSAEAFKCVDNMGVLHEKNETYTHVDGCNTCKCGEHGGACTRKFCIKKEVISNLSYYSFIMVTYLEENALHLC